ncbi:MAG TPA: alpha/beta hydrolase [Aggregatilineales bacterium]|nr:alpha/beta hydrolase [Anaerolineales bacterium]HRE46127.1 alpha/beta hydrolase [Aggregatilineales bacterium]
MPIPTISGITAQTITTARLTTRVLFSAAEGGTPVLFVHGNASSATFWEEVMVALPAGFRGIAPDLRGYGDAERTKKVNATRGMGDFSDDLVVLLDHLNVSAVHVVGHSMGGSVIWRLMMDAPARLLSVTLACPGSPYGFGGTKGLDGTPCQPDFAGSGGGIVNPVFAQRMAAGDRGVENPQTAPRIVMNTFYFKPPFASPREEDLLSSMLAEHVGEQEYPGDSIPSPNYPFAAPGVWGPANALSPKYTGDVSRLFNITPKPPVLWVRGSDDQIVSDNSLFDMGTLGMLGAIPNYPGTEVYPPQPMVSQTRTVLEKYAVAGGRYKEAVLAETGHTPYLEKPAEFNALFHAHLKGGA